MQDLDGEKNFLQVCVMRVCVMRELGLGSRQGAGGIINAAQCLHGERGGRNWVWF